MQRLRQQHHQSQRIFTASEVAEYEYCPLVWWHEQFEPLVGADTEELFARLVELEQELGQQATTVPEYQTIEQLLVRRGAFETGRQQHLEHAEQVAELEEERSGTPQSGDAARRLVLIAGVLLLLALALILASFIFPGH